jgi:hypothetical protein
LPTNPGSDVDRVDRARAGRLEEPLPMAAAVAGQPIEQHREHGDGRVVAITAVRETDVVDAVARRRRHAGS